MNSQKFILATIVGGITLFILGYLFYGMLLVSFFNQHSIAPAGSMRTMSELIWWALIVGNFAGAALLAYIFQKIGNVHSFATGARIGAAIGLFMGLAVDLISYATGKSFDLTGMLGDVVVRIVMTAIAGGVIALVLKSGAKKA